MAESHASYDGFGYGIWEVLTLRDGLPDMKIECITADRDDGIWIGTHDRGLVYYNGDEFKSYGVREGLPGNGVFSILQHEGYLYLGTDGGLCRFDGRSIEVLAQGTEYRFLWGSGVLDNDTLLFGLEYRPGQPPAVFVWADGAGRVVEIDASPDRHGISVNHLASAAGTVWVGTDALYRTHDGCNFEQVATLGEPVQCIEVGDDGVVWIGTETGFSCFRDGQLVELFAAQETRYGPVSLRLDALGRCWFLTYDGRICYHDGNDVHVVHHLPAVHRGGFVVDVMDRWWIGTYGMGLYYCDPVRFRVFGSREGVPSGPGTCLSAGDDGVIWCGTAAGVAGIAPGGMVNLAHGEHLQNRQITGLAGDSTGDLWIGTRNGFLYRHTPNGLVCCSRGTDMRAYSIDSLIAARDGTIWFGSRYGGGLGSLSDGQYRPFHPEYGDPVPGWVSAIAQHEDGSIWISSATPYSYEGLCCHRQGSFQQIGVTDGASVLALCGDRAGRIWMGTNDGAACLEDDAILVYTREDGLPYGIVTAVTEGHDGVIWLGTDGGGLCGYDGEVFQSVQLPGDPLLNVVHDVCQGPDGAVWYGTNAGVVRYVQRPAEVTVKVVRVVADVVSPFPEQVQFTTSARRVTFHFRGCSRLEPSKFLVYRYRLVGHAGDSGQWIQTTEQQAEYSELDPGQYEFQVQAIDRDLNYSPTASVNVTVNEDPRVAALNEALRSDAARGDFIGESTALTEVRRQIQEVAWTDLTVLILGETGTGKGLAAKAIYEMSERHGRPFIHVNCGALQQDLVNSELFGHEKGAFTGAVSRRIGRFELADTGTIFLDEIGDLPPESQTRLLHVLQHRQIERLGGTETIPLDVRVIAATNRELAQAVRAGNYRADLYYRLNVFPVRIPPLRERKDDIPLLADYFIRKFSAHLDCPQPQLDEDALQTMMEYDWPGNVRELEHTLQRAVLLAKDGLIVSNHMGFGIGQGSTPPATGDQEIVPLVEFERRYLAHVLRCTNGVIHGSNGAARLLGMKPTTLRSRLDKLGLSKNDFQVRH